MPWGNPDSRCGSHQQSRRIELNRLQLPVNSGGRRRAGPGQRGITTYIRVAQASSIPLVAHCHVLFALGRSILLEP